MSLSLFHTLHRAALRRAQSIVLSLALLISSAVSAHELEWRQTLPTGYGRHMGKLANGDFILAANVGSGNAADFRITRHKSTDGSLVWSQTFDHDNDDSINDLIVDPVTEEIYFCGTSSSLVNLQYDSNWYVMKLNGADGSFGWPTPHIYNSNVASVRQSDMAKKMAFIQDGADKNIVVVGSANGTGGRVAKLKGSDGTLLWEHVSGVNGNDYANVVGDLVRQTFYVSGETKTVPPNLAVIVKFNVGSSTPVWVRNYGPNGGGFNRWSHLALEPASGDVITAGLIYGTSSNDIGLARYKEDGTRLWEKILDSGTNGNDSANAVIVDGNNIYLAGAYRPSSNLKWFIASYNLDGASNWAPIVTGGDWANGSNQARNIQVLGSTLYITGTFTNEVAGVGQRQLVLKEIDKLTKVELESTIFTDRLGVDVQGTNRSVIITSDGHFIVAGDNGNPIAPEIARYSPGSGSEPPVSVTPTITTPTSASVAMNTATLGGNVTADGGAALIERGVIYSLTSANADPLIGDANVTKVAATAPHTTGVFTVNVASLTAKSGYTYKAYAQNSVGTSYTTSSSFTTTGPTISVSGNSAVIANGDNSPSASDHTVFNAVNVAGGISTRAFSISNTGTANLTLGSPAVTVTGSDFSVTAAPNSTVAVGGTTSFTITFDPSTTGVKTSTVTIANNDTSYTFAIQGASNGIPTVTASAATLVKGYSATLNGTVNPNGLATTYLFEYSTDPDLNADVVSTSVQNAASSYSSSAATAAISELQADTVYYYRLVAGNSLGQSQSAVWSFTTAYPLSTNEPLSALNGMPEGGLIYRPIPGVINNAGRILFQSIGLVGTGMPAITGSNDELLMNDVTGIPVVILREGAQLGSQSGNTASALFNHLLLGESGQSFTSEKITGAATDKDYAYLVIPENGGTVEMVSQEGDNAPNGGVFINSVSKPVMDGQERFYFQGSLSGVATTLATGVWFDEGDGVSTLVKAGQDLVEITEDPAWLGKVSNILAAGGNGVAFVAALQPNPTDVKEKTNTLRNQAILSANVGGDGVELSIIARKGDAITGGSTLNNITAVSRSVTEAHAFVALMKTGPGVTSVNDEVLVAVIDGESTLVAREGTTELDAGLTAKSLGDFYITADGNVVFQAVLNGVPATSDGILCIWLAASNTVEKLAREGDAAPGTGGLNYGTLHTVGVSDNGNIVLQTILSDGKHGLHRNVGTGFELVVKAGATDTIDYGGVPRAILSIGLYNKTTGTGGGGGGMGSAINNAGDVFAVLSIGTGDYVARVYRGAVLSAPGRPANR